MIQYFGIVIAIVNVAYLLFEGIFKFKNNGFAQTKLWFIKKLIGREAHQTQHIFGPPFKIITGMDFEETINRGVIYEI